MKNKNLEVRSFDASFSESEGKTVQGRGVVFESLSNDLQGFKEIIKRGASKKDSKTFLFIIFCILSYFQYIYNFIIDKNDTKNKICLFCIKII